MPVQPGLGLDTGGRHIQADEHCHPSKMRRRFIRADRNDGQVQTSTKRLDDFAATDPFFADRMISSPLFALFYGEPIETRHIGEMASRPAVTALAHEGADAFLPSDSNQRRDETLLERVVNLRQTYHRH